MGALVERFRGEYRADSSGLHPDDVELADRLATAFGEAVADVEPSYVLHLAITMAKVSREHGTPLDGDFVKKAKQAAKSVLAKRTSQDDLREFVDDAIAERTRSEEK